MFLIILGFLILIAAFTARRSNNQVFRYFNFIAAAAIFIVLVGASTSMFKVVGTGEVGVTSRF